MQQAEVICWCCVMLAVCQVLVTNLHMAHNFNWLSTTVCLLPLSNTTTFWYFHSILSLCCSSTHTHCNDTHVVEDWNTDRHGQTCSEYAYSLKCPTWSNSSYQFAADFHSPPHLSHAYQAPSPHSFFTDTPTQWSCFFTHNRNKHLKYDLKTGLFECELLEC